MFYDGIFLSVDIHYYSLIVRYICKHRKIPWQNPWQNLLDLAQGHLIDGYLCLGRDQISGPCNDEKYWLVDREDRDNQIF